MTSHLKPVGIALSGEHLAALLADRALTARLNASGLPFAVAGIDRVDPAIPRPEVSVPGRAVDSLAAAATLADWAPDLGWLAVAAAHRDLPYGVAHRVASADRHSEGRSGLVLGLRERSVLAGYDGREAAASNGLTTPSLAGAGATRDAAAAIRTLWRTAPASAQGTPVLAWRAESTGEAAAASRVADILIWPAGRPERLGAAVAASSGGPRLFLEVLAGGADLAARLAGYLADDRVAGVILRPEGNETGLREFTAHALPELTRSGALSTGWAGTLRQRLSLPVPGLARAAVPAPAPEPALA